MQIMTNKMCLIFTGVLDGNWLSVTEMHKWLKVDLKKKTCQNTCQQMFLEIVIFSYRIHKIDQRDSKDQPFKNI